MEKKCVYCGSVIAEGAETFDSMLDVCCSEKCATKQIVREGEAAIYAQKMIKRLCAGELDAESAYAEVKQCFGKTIADAMLKGKINNRVEKHVINVKINGGKVTIKGYSNGTIVLNGRGEVEAMKETIEGVLQSMGGEDA